MLNLINMAIVYRNEDDIKMTAIREENAYYVKSKIMENERVATVEDIDIWHKRFGHTNKKLIEEMKRENLVIGINENKEQRQCEPCVEGKMCRKAHPRLISRKTSKIMKLWHIDLIGPIHPSSCGGKKYIFTIVDDYFRVIFVELLEEKGEGKFKKINYFKGKPVWIKTESNQIR